MTTINILYPCFAMVMLTFIVWTRIYAERIKEVKTRQLHPQNFATSHTTSKIVEQVQANDNFRNLFELPVLFYLLCVLLYVTETVTLFFVIGAWLFVILRATHSYIHCTYNKVMHRFMVYVSGGAILFTLWGTFILKMISLDPQ